MSDSSLNPNRDGDKTPQDYLRNLKANYPDLKHKLEMRLFEGVADETKTVTVEDLIKRKENALYFKNCRNSNFKVARNVESVKIMIEHCHNCTFTIHGPVKTTVLEIWRCDDSSLNIDTEINTLQIDLVKNFNLTYHHKKYLGSIVQAGARAFKVAFLDHPELNFTTGFEVLAETHEGINDLTDQFITRFVDGQLLTEEVIRYQDGFFTTEREKSIADEERERNEGAAEQKVRDMLKFAGPAMGLGEDDIAAKSKEGKEEQARKSELEAKANMKKHSGNKAFTNQKYDEALKLFSEAIDLVPDNHVLFSNRAMVYLTLKRFEEALADAEKCVALSPAFSKGHYRRGLALLELGRATDAVASLTEAHDLEPLDEDILSSLSSAKARLA